MTYMTLSYTAFADEAERELERMGLAKPRRPGDELQVVDDRGVVNGWPADNLGRIPWGGLSAWLGALAAWRDYIGHFAGIADYVYATAEAERKRRFSVAYARSSHAKVTDRREEAKADPDVLACSRVVDEADARRRLLAARAEGFATMYAAVSREISRREGTMRSEGGAPQRPRSKFNRRGP